MHVLLIDNYDSFTYNLYQYVGELLQSRLRRQPFQVTVIRNDERTLEDIQQLTPDKIIISPGPGSPDDPNYFGICRQVILQLGPHIPLLGVCLGMQGLASCFGAKVIRAPNPMHGKTSVIVHDGLGVYQNMPQQLEIMRYHSLMVAAESLPECLKITSVVMPAKNGVSDREFTSHLVDVSETSLKKLALQGQEIMGVRHTRFPIEGIQYHPESFATEGGKELLANFIFG